MTDFESDAILRIADLGRRLVADYVDGLARAMEKETDVSDLKADGVYSTAVLSLLLYGALEWSRASGVNFTTAFNDMVDIDAENRALLARKQSLQ
jgi:ethanolamine ammonia-lyase small subunit